MNDKEIIKEMKLYLNNRIKDYTTKQGYLCDEGVAYRLVLGKLENLTKHNREINKSSNKKCPECGNPMDREEYLCCNNSKCINEGVMQKLKKR